MTREKPIEALRRRRNLQAGFDYSGAVRGFFRERWSFISVMFVGFKYDIVNAVLAADSDDVVDVVARAEAVKQSFAYARVPGDRRGMQADEKHSATGAKKKVLSQHRSSNTCRNRAQEEKESGAYIETDSPRSRSTSSKERIRSMHCLLLSTARERVDTFFEKVMVMVDDDRHTREPPRSSAEHCSKNFPRSPISPKS